jgi:hypothetical protein
LPNRISLFSLQQRLNFFNVPQFETIATQGIGIFETLKSVITLIMKNIH